MGNTANNRTAGNFVHDLWIFDDYADFLHTITDLSQDSTALASRWGTSSTGAGRADWSGSETMEEAIRFATDGGWHGATQFEAIVESIQPHVMAARQVRAEDLAPAGYMPNVPAFCAGSPASMHTHGDESFSRAPVLHFMVNRSALANVEASAIINRGAAILAMVQYFEDAGVRVGLDVYMAAQGSGMGKKGLHEVIVPVKAPDQHIETDRLAFVLANPAVHRRFSFLLRELNRDLYGAGFDDYGISTDSREIHDIVYFPALRSGRNLHDPDEALRTVIAQVQNQLPDEMRHRVSEDWAAVLDSDSQAAVA